MENACGVECHEATVEWSFPFSIQIVKFPMKRPPVNTLFLLLTTLRHLGHLATIDEGYFSGCCHAEGRCAGSITLFAMPVEESFQGTMVDILPECCLSAVPRGREFPVLVFLFFRPECPLQPCRSVGAGDPREPCASKLPRSDPHSACAKSPPPERPPGPAVLGLVFGTFFHPTKKMSIWGFRRSDWPSAGNLTLFAICA